MGKITDYFEQCRRDEEERKRNETVAKFAKDLNKSVEVLIGQLQAAGVKKISETDRVTEADKQTLLQYLKKSHGLEGSRKKITLIKNTGESEEQRLMKAVAAQENGAEWECLQHFVDHVYWGSAIDLSFQAVVNLIVAKLFIYQALPLKKIGRPKSQETENLGRQVAQEYWDMLDGGASYSEAVQHLANKVHKDERQIMRYVEKHKNMVGLTFEVRKENREQAAVRREMYHVMNITPFDSYSSTIFENLEPLPEFELNDYIEYFDEQIVKAVQSKKPTDIK